jgi:hypothetical protein
LTRRKEIRTLGVMTIRRILVSAMACSHAQHQKKKNKKNWRLWRSASAAVGLSWGLRRSSVDTKSRASADIDSHGGDVKSRSAYSTARHKSWRTDRPRGRQSLLSRGHRSCPICPKPSRRRAREPLRDCMSSRGSCGTRAQEPIAPRRCSAAATVSVQPRARSGGWVGPQQPSLGPSALCSTRSLIPRHP